MKATTLAIITGAALSVASVGAAYPYPEMYELDAAGPVSLRPGGAGVYGTGGKHDFGVECNDCHIGSVGTLGLLGIDISLVGGQWQSVGGQPAYKPGETYTIQVTMTNERFTTAPEPHNGFAATIEDSSGQLAGVLRSDGTGCAAVASNTANCPDAAAARNCRSEPDMTTTSTMLGDCKVVVNQSDDTKGHYSTWKFSWTAPAAGAGTVTLFVGVVDGSGVDPTRDAWGNPTNPDRTDLSSLDDEAANTTLVLLEGS